jgi:hypothetical protein
MKVLLYGGSELCVNRMGRIWTVDIFPSFHSDDTPVLKGEAVEPTTGALGGDLELGRARK